MSPTVDDNLQTCLDFVLRQLEQRRQIQDKVTGDAPFLLGLSGVQGCGKTTLVSSLAEKLRQPPHSLPTIVLSIDDLYLPRREQAQLAAQHPHNPLVQHRGQPSTHDVDLGLSLLSCLRKGEHTKIPAYDKSAFNGLGDRVPETQWQAVNSNGEFMTKVIILEGWCVGFRPLDHAELKRKWELAVSLVEQGCYRGRLGYNKLEDVEFINDALKAYEQLTNQFDAIIHIDAEETMYVYAWRMEQEEALRKSKGSGMTDEQVVDFVNGYYPAYELFADKLRQGSSVRGRKAQLRIVIGRDRRMKQVVLI